MGFSFTSFTIVRSAYHFTCLLSHGYKYVSFFLQKVFKIYSHKLFHNFHFLFVACEDFHRLLSGLGPTVGRIFCDARWQKCEWVSQQSFFYVLRLIECRVVEGESKSTISVFVVESTKSALEHWQPRDYKINGQREPMREERDYKWSVNVGEGLWVCVGKFT